MVSTAHPSRRQGQAIVFLLMALSILLFYLLYTVDLQRIIQRKDQTQNAGDAAALAAARWQGATLNLIGELNLIHALALTQQDDAAIDAITNLQARLCFTGPLTALTAAQLAAKNNRIYVDEGMSQILFDHAQTIRTDYAQLFDGAMAYPEPWPGAWTEYADLITRIAENGIAAGPDNLQSFTLGTDHLLLNKAFYEAVEGYSWCWFYRNARGLLESYSSFQDWAPLPDTDVSSFSNSEIFGLKLQPLIAPLQQILPAETIADAAAKRALPLTQTALTASNAMTRAECWFVYDPGDWGTWDLMKPDGEDAFPVTGPVRPEYDTAGADAILRVSSRVTRITADESEQKETVVWTAAAKPFGFLETDSGREPVTAAAFFTLPAFRNVRLIPVDAASNASASSADVDWVRHIRSHLKIYLQSGNPPANGCRFCRILRFWEQNPEQRVTERISDESGGTKVTTVTKPFRQIGSDWIREFGKTCRQYSSGGNRGGGTRRGH